MIKHALIFWVCCGLCHAYLLANECASAQSVDRYHFTDEVGALDLNWSQENTAPCEFSGGSKWYRLETNGKGIFNIDSRRSDFPTLLALYEGSCDNLIAVECRGGNQLSRELEAGNTYYIQALATSGSADTKLRLDMNQRGNVRLGFPQLAVGDVVISTVDLTNQGTEAFQGLLSVLDNDGTHLDVSINGTLVDDDYPIHMEPRTVKRLKIARPGDPVPGHILLYDRSALKTLDVKAQIDGTLSFQFTNRGELTDSIGVPASSVFYGPGVKEHFHFFVENSDGVRTGLALSHPGSPHFFPSSIRLRAFSESGMLQDETTTTIEPLHHESFYLDQKLNLPADFAGLAVVESNLPLFVLALRSERNLLSTVQVSPAPAVYDFTIELSDARLFSGEMSLNIADVRVQGLGRFTSRTPDRDFEVTPVTGAAIAGLFIAGMYSSFDETPVVITLVTPFARTNLSQIGGSVVWSELGKMPVVGSFTAIRQGDPGEPAEIPRRALELLARDKTEEVGSRPE